ncbi:hypothetical protein Tco_0637166 [Tanacetum coccineum]
MQTLIPTPTRSPRKDLSSDKTVLEELTVHVSPNTDTTSKHKSKKGFTSNKTEILPGSIAGIEVLNNCNNVVPELTFAKSNEMIKEEMPRLVDLAIQKDREIASTSVPELISKEFATHGPKLIEELFLGHILLDHPLSYAFTATADIPAGYLQQFWKIVSKVHDTKDTIRFKLDTQDIVYTVDMFRDTLHFPVETPDNPFITPVTIKLLSISCRRLVIKNKDVIQYPRFTQLIIADLMKKYPFIPHRPDEDYHFIKDDIPLEYEIVFVRVEVPMNQPQLVISTQGTHRNTPRAHKTPTLIAVSPQGKKRKQSAGETSSPRKSLKVTIRQKKQSTTLIPPLSDDRERDEIVEATLLSLTLHKTALAAEAKENFIDSVFNDDDDFGTRIEPGSHKENLKVVDEDEVNDKVKQDEKKDDDTEKTDDAAKEKDTDGHTNHTLVETYATGKIREVLDHCNNVVPEMTFAKTNEMIKEEMPRLVNLAVNKDREIVPTNIPELISKEFATHGPKMIEELFRKHIRVHNFQVGYKGLSIRVNLTASTLTFPGIEAHELYSIVDKPTTGLIYLNNKDEKQVMYLMEIVKFCDATLEKVLKEVKLKIF